MRASSSANFFAAITPSTIACVALEVAAFQTREVLAAMVADSGVEIAELRVDGGMAANELLMQFQTDILGAPVVRPLCIETSAIGAAYAADRRWEPRMERSERDRLVASWEKAVARSLGWKA